MSRLALTLTMVAIATGCRIYEEQKAEFLRTASAAVFSPFVEAQRTTTLTQGTFRRASTVAPNNGPKTAETKAVDRLKAIERLAEPAMTPCRSTFTRQPNRPDRDLVKAAGHETVVGG